MSKKNKSLSSFRQRKHEFMLSIIMTSSNWCIHDHVTVSHLIAWRLLNTRKKTIFSISPILPCAFFGFLCVK